MKCDWCGENHDTFSLNKAYEFNILKAENKLCKWCFITQSVYNTEKLKIQNYRLYKECKKTAHKLLKKEGGKR